MSRFAIRRLQDLSATYLLAGGRIRPYMRLPLNWFFNCRAQHQSINNFRPTA